MNMSPLSELCKFVNSGNNELAAKNQELAAQNQTLTDSRTELHEYSFTFKI